MHWLNRLVHARRSVIAIGLAVIVALIVVYAKCATIRRVAERDPRLNVASHVPAVIISGRTSQFPAGDTLAIDGNLAMNPAATVGDGTITTTLTAQTAGTPDTLWDLVDTVAPPSNPLRTFRSQEYDFNEGAYFDHVFLPWAWNSGISGISDNTAGGAQVSFESDFISAGKHSMEWHEIWIDTAGNARRWLDSSMAMDGSLVNTFLNGTNLSFGDGASPANPIVTIANPTTPLSGPSQMLVGATSPGADLAVESTDATPFEVGSPGLAQTYLEVTSTGMFVDAYAGSSEITSSIPLVLAIQNTNASGTSAASAQLAINSNNGAFTTSLLSSGVDGTTTLSNNGGGIAFTPHNGATVINNSTSHALLTEDDTGALNVYGGSSPLLTFQVDALNDIFQRNGAAYRNAWFADGHWVSEGPAASSSNLSSCGGAGLAIVGTDNVGAIVIGAGATACTFTFTSSFAGNVSCLITGSNGTVPQYDDVSGAGASLTITVGVAGVRYHYACTGLTGAG